MTPEAQKVQQYIEANPICRNSHIAKALGVTPQTIHKHTNKLMEKGLIQRNTNTSSKIKEFIAAGVIVKNKQVHQYRYIEVKRGEALIERLSTFGLSSLQVEDKIHKVSRNIPNTYRCEVVTYPIALRCGYFSENL